MSDGKRPGAVSAFRVPMLLLLPGGGSFRRPGAVRPAARPASGRLYGRARLQAGDRRHLHARPRPRLGHRARVAHRLLLQHLPLRSPERRRSRWDPANTAGASLSAKVETASITSNVKGFGEQLAGDEFLKSRAFPEATFVSTAFRQTSPRRGKVDGQLTLMGKTRAVTFDVELVGAGKGFAGQPRMGMNARTSINPVDFGLPPLLGDAIEIVVDAEFQRNP